MGTGLLALLPVLTAAGGAAGSYLSTSAGISAANKQQDKQIDLQRETNAQNYKIWQESQDFAREQADTQWQREMEMFNMENSYNNPVNVVGRLREAGLNPALAMQGSLGSAMSSAASGGSPTIGNNPTPPTMQAPNIMNSPLAQLYANRATGLSDASLKASQVLKNLAEAKKQGIETNRLESTVYDFIEQQRQETLRMNLENYGRDFENQMIAKYGEKIKKSELESLIEDVKNKILQGDNIQSDTYLKNQQSYLANVEGKEKEAYYAHVEEFITNMLNLGKEQIKTEQTKQNLNIEQGKSEQQRRSLMLSEENVNKVNKVYISELTKMSTAERKELIANSLALYEDESGVHINEKEKARVVKLSLEHMEKVIRQQGADYWNPFKYVGHLLGGSGTYNFTPQQSTRSVIRGFAK